jgi:hypothetical protein
VSYYGWKPYVPVAERRRKAAAAAAKNARKGAPMAPLQITGRKIATTFWGRAWCDHLERYSDFENRLPRGRSYARNGSVVDLQIAAGEVSAKVHGSRMYTVTVAVAALPAARWQALRRDCSGAIDSLVGLLQGQLSAPVMTRLCEPKTGLFPAPSELKFSCSCPDWASMCKHVAAALYGIGNRLDSRPDLLFLLRKVDQAELIDLGAGALPIAGSGAAAGRVIAGADLGALFGLEFDAVADSPAPVTAPKAKTKPKPKPAGKRATVIEKRAGDRKAATKPAAAKPRKTATSKTAALQKTTAKPASKRSVAARKTAAKPASNTKVAARKAVAKLASKNTVAARKAVTKPAPSAKAAVASLKPSAKTHVSVRKAPAKPAARRKAATKSAGRATRVPKRSVKRPS